MRQKCYPIANFDYISGLDGWRQNVSRVHEIQVGRDQKRPAQIMETDLYLILSSNLLQHQIKTGFILLL